MSVFNTWFDWEIHTIFASWLHLSKVFSLTCLPCSKSWGMLLLWYGDTGLRFIPHSLFHITSSVTHPFISGLLANLSICCMTGGPCKHNITKVTKHSQAKPNLLLILSICVCIFNSNIFIKFWRLLEKCFISPAFLYALLTDT